MGGDGSGRYHWATSRDTTEDTHNLNLQWMMRRDPPGCRVGQWHNVRWTRGGRETGSIQAYIGPSDTDLIYCINGESVEQRVHMVATPCRFGGQQYCWECPFCGRRCLVLHLVGKRFRCRRCANLSYESQRERSHERALRKAQKIRERLGGSGSMLEPFPAKPRRMRWVTYERLQQAYAEAEARDLAGMLARFKDLGG
jgi:hypothetical protein